jgi:hypothetical protein
MVFVENRGFLSGFDAFSRYLRGLVSTWGGNFAKSAANAALRGRQKKHRARPGITPPHAA